MTAHRAEIDVILGWCIVGGNVAGERLAELKPMNLDSP